MKGLAWAGEGVQAGVRKRVRVLVLGTPRGYVASLWLAGPRAPNQSQEIYSRIRESLQPITDRKREE
jgi:hypothetical protein